MSNGTRLMALVVVVVLAAVGLYYAFMMPSGTPPVVPVPINTALPDGTVTAPAPPVGGLGESRSGTVAGEAVRPVTPPPSGAFSPPSGAARNPATAPKEGATATPKAGVNGATSGPVPVGASTPNGGSPSVPAPSHTSAPAANTTEYTIQSGDTLEGLARRFLGDGAKAKAIQDANPGIVATSLKVGQKINIPGANATSTSGAGSTSTPPSTGTSANTYTVQKGDSLIAIARKVYGSETDWRRILEANSATLKGNAEALQPGMKLTIPAKRS